MDSCFSSLDAKLSLNSVVSLCDRQDLFEFCDNERVVRLSRQGNAVGFSTEASVLRSTGVAQRRILRPGVTPLDLAVEVIQQVQHVCGLNLQNFAAVFLCHSHTCSKESGQLAEQIAARTGRVAPVIYAYNSGCTGYLKLLAAATGFMNSTPTAERVLLLNIETPETWHCSADRMFCGIVGAGATATVLQRGSGMKLYALQVEDVPITVTGNVLPGPLFQRETTHVYSFRGEPAVRNVMRMNAESVFFHGIELMLQALRTAAENFGPSDGHRVIVIPHQPSGKLLRALIATAKLEFPEFHYINNLLNHGNTISSTIPVILARFPEVLREHRLEAPQPGDRIILIASGICMDRIADHMATGFASLEWDPSFRCGSPDSVF
jgi:3-oxoacyl-[acyl-carrier-protein] synthase-3